MAVSYTLRPALPVDEPFLRALYGESRADELAPLVWDDATRDAFLDSQFDLQRAHYEQHYPRARHEIVLVEGEPAGRIWIEVQAAQVRLIDLSLRTAMRGQGVGGALLRDLRLEARGLGLPVTLHVVHGNERAKRFYERLGFSADQDIGSHLRMRWDPA